MVVGYWVGFWVDLIMEYEVLKVVVVPSSWGCLCVQVPVVRMLMHLVVACVVVAVIVLVSKAACVEVVWYLLDEVGSLVAYRVVGRCIPCLVLIALVVCLVMHRVVVRLVG